MNRLILPLTIMVALVLAMLPMPLKLDVFRPDWVSLVLIYWIMATPHKINVGIAWLVGLVLDVLLGSTLGVHALALAIIAYLVALNFQKIRTYSVWQQGLIVMFLICAKLLLVYWVEHITNRVQLPPGYFWPVLTSGLMWLWCFPVLRKIRRRFRIR
ncbi:rod shape-determining protein MreD [Gallaecimonas sp. GXIMD4217]|uniref:rod shape-determining protein MreD n=1 Tax=Gallaecimonas sp. GXIMD4217 TaxID=3131927 RepID=UPI00311AECAF